MIEYEDGERQLIDLRAEKFRDCVEGDESERDDDSLEGDDDVNDFSLIKKGAVIELLWPYVNIYFEAKIVSFCPLQEGEEKPNVAKSKRGVREEASVDEFVGNGEKETKRPHAKNETKEHHSVNELDRKSKKTKKSMGSARSNEIQNYGEEKLDDAKTSARQISDEEKHRHTQSPQSKRSTRSMECHGNSDVEQITKPHDKSDSNETKVRKTADKKGELARNLLVTEKRERSIVEKDENIKPDDRLVSESTVPPAKSKGKSDDVLQEAKSKKRPREKDEERDRAKTDDLVDIAILKRSRKEARELLLTQKKQKEDALASSSSSHQNKPLKGSEADLTVSKEKDELKGSNIEAAKKANELPHPHTKPHSKVLRKPIPPPPPTPPPPLHDPDNKMERRGKRDKKVAKSSLSANSPLGTKNDSDMMSSASRPGGHSLHQGDCSRAKVSNSKSSNKKGSLSGAPSATGKDHSKMKKSKNRRNDSAKSTSRTAGLSNTLTRLSAKKCSIENDEYLKSINSDDETSEISKVEYCSEKPPERVGHGVPLFNEPEDEFDSDVDESESDLSDDEIRQTAAGLDFEKIWRMKLNQTSEMLKSRRAFGGYVDVKRP